MKAIQSIQSLIFGLLLSAGTLLVFTPTVAAAPTLPPPEKEVEEFTRELLALYDKNKEEYRKDKEAFIKEVDRLLSPVVAFDQIARYVMGKYTRRNPAEVDKFEKVFKDSLFNFYGNALLSLDDTSLTIDSVDKTSPDQMKKYIEGEIRRIPVKMKVKTSSRTLEIFYSMVHVNGRWKLRNITLEGINIAKQFQSQFANAVDRHGKVEYVVAHWAEIMAASDTDKNKKKDDKGKK
ncbi:MAG: MlaC/ttg2D family ABC transporter substrate-binding protein [Endozoicomonas sp.]